MSKLIPLAEAAAALGVSVDTVRRRLRAGTLEGEKESTPPGRWRVRVPADAQQGLGDHVGEHLAVLEGENAALRRELATANEALRFERDRWERTVTTFEQMARALPAPRRRGWRWPWTRQP